MSKVPSRATSFAKTVDGFSYDQCCLIDAQGDHLEAFTSVLSAYNVAKIENCLDLDILDRILTASRDIFKNRDEIIKTNGVPEASRLNYRRRTILVAELNIDITPHLLPEIIVQGAREFLGKEPTQAVSSVRAIVPGSNDQRLPFHQDQAILQTPLLNIWIPLTPCGVTAPSLEVAVTNERKLLEVIGSEDDEIPVERVRIDERLVFATFGTHSLWHPVMMPGEVLVFTGTTPHRTYVTPEMYDTRISIEFRFV